MLSIAILMLHFYLSCYLVFEASGFHSEITDRILSKISLIGVFDSGLLSKSVAFLLLLISLMGTRGRKDELTDLKTWTIGILIGIVLYYGSVYCFRLELKLNALVLLYISSCSVGYLLILTSGTRLTRLLRLNLTSDIFNKDNETFPQEKRKIENPNK